MSEKEIHSPSQEPPEKVREGIRKSILQVSRWVISVIEDSSKDGHFSFPLLIDPNTRPPDIRRDIDPILRTRRALRGERL